MEKTDLKKIESEEVAFDILYGNTPKDMLNRAFINDYLISIIDKLKADSNLIEVLIKRFTDYQSKQSDNDLLYNGKLIAYLAVLSKAGSSSAIDELVKFKDKIEDQSLLFEVAEYCIHKAKKNQKVEIGSYIDFYPKDKFDDIFELSSTFTAYTIYHQFDFDPQILAKSDEDFKKQETFTATI